MLTFPNAKINIGLNIVARRSDGYHNLETIFYPVSLCDTLEIVPAREPQRGEVQLTTYGIPVEGAAQDNLVVKAYHLLRRECEMPPVEIYLYKNIPSGAGMGGGSSDAAFALKMLNELFSLGLDTAALEARASLLGADCAFFIQDKPLFATGIGNVFAPACCDLSSYRIAIVKPPVFVSTREAYSGVQPHPAQLSPVSAVKQPIEEWKEILVNDFEPHIFAAHPKIEETKEELYRCGALYASMSGSGSAVYGIFRELPKGLKEHFPGCFYFANEEKQGA